MPTVAVCDEQRRDKKNKAFNRWVKGQLAEHDLSQEALASELGITQQGLSFRLKNGSAFSYPQMLAIFKLFKTSDEVILKLMKM